MQADQPPDNRSGEVPDPAMSIQLRKVNGIMCHELKVEMEISGSENKIVQLFFYGDSEDFEESLSAPFRLYSMLEEYINQADKNWDKAVEFKQEGMENEVFNAYYRGEEEIAKIFSEIQNE